MDKNSNIFLLTFYLKVSVLLLYFLYMKIRESEKKVRENVILLIHSDCYKVKMERDM